MAKASKQRTTVRFLTAAQWRLVQRAAKRRGKELAVHCREVVVRDARERLRAR